MGGRGSVSASGGSSAGRVFVGGVDVLDAGGLDISNPAAFVTSMGASPRRGETERSRAFAKVYVASFDRRMTESEVSEAVRLLTYRGRGTPKSVADAVAKAAPGMVVRPSVANTAELSGSTIEASRRQRR